MKVILNLIIIFSRKNFEFLNASNFKQVNFKSFLGNFNEDNDNGVANFGVDRVCLVNFGATPEMVRKMVKSVAKNYAKNA